MRTSADSLPSFSPVACLLVLKLTRLFSEGVDLPSLISKAAQLQSSLSDFPGAQRFSMTIKIALDRFAKSFNLEIPSHKPDLLTGAFSDPSLLTPFANPFPFLGNNHVQFDMQALPNSDWVGSELFPEWIKTDTGEQDWTFGTAFDEGIDRLFLPQCVFLLFSRSVRLVTDLLRSSPDGPPAFKIKRWSGRDEEAARRWLEGRDRRRARAGDFGSGSFTTPAICMVQFDTVWLNVKRASYQRPVDRTLLRPTLGPRPHCLSFSPPSPSPRLLAPIAGCSPSSLPCRSRRARRAIINGWRT